jgi:GNAT superfamily N-acetyltransferase
MSVRPAAYDDLLPASKILAAAFKDEALFGGHFHPYRASYPDDMHLFFLQKLRLDWARTSSPEDLQILLSHPPANPAQITGVAIWSRKRATPNPDSPSVAAKVKEMEALNAAEARENPNRAAEVKNQGILAASERFIEHHWSGSRAECWDLGLLGVDPEQGGCGYGKVLVKYGLEIAKAEGVSASVISALGRESFYTSLGFNDTVATVRDFGGSENPFHGREDLGGTIHFCDFGREPARVRAYGEK